MIETSEERRNRPCRVCGGKGTTPMATIALAMPARERRKLDRQAADNPVQCYACRGSGKAWDNYEHLVG